MHYLGIDIGGTKVKTLILNEQSDVIHQDEVFTEDGSGELWKQKIIQILNRQFSTYGKRELVCGISAPGLVDETNRKTMYMPERLQGIENYNWSEELGQEIWALNDGHSACLAEYESFFKKEGVQNLVMLTLGTGVGGGIVINGELYQGKLQRAGHLGHMTADLHGPNTMTNMPGSLEYAIGNFSVGQRTEGKFQTVLDLVKAFENGDEIAKRFWYEAVEKLAVSLAGLNNILAPEVIVLGGGITKGAGDSLLKPLAEFMEKFEWRPGGNKVRIETAKYGTFAGAIGAALFAKKQHEKGIK